MIKKLLLTATVMLSLVGGNTSATVSNSYGHVEKQPQIYGPFKLYTDEYDTFIITSTKWHNIDFNHHQVLNLYGNSYEDYFKFNNPKQKALWAYQLLIKIANKADFHITKRKKNNELVITIFQKSALRYGVAQTLIPNKDMKTVFPLLLDLIKSNTAIDFNFSYDTKDRKIINSRQHQATKHTPQQAWAFADDFHYGFDLLTPEDKALKAYMYLLELSLKANFKVKYSEQFQENNPVMLYIAAQGIDKGIEVELIPDNDVASVYPLLIEFTKDRPSTYYKDPKIVAAEISKNNKAAN